MQSKKQTCSGETSGRPTLVEWRPSRMAELGLARLQQGLVGCRVFLVGCCIALWGLCELVLSPHHHFWGPGCIFARFAASKVQPQGRSCAWCTSVHIEGFVVADHFR